MRSIILATAITGFLTLSTSSQAADLGLSRAMQLAKRVAAMENSKDLPSRAVWLSNRVVKNSRSLAYQVVKSKASKKRPVTVKN